MKTKSFVDGFRSRKISTETLTALLQVPYQREILFELVFGEDIGPEVEILKMGDQIVKAETKECMIFLLLCTHDKVVQKVRDLKTAPGQEKKVLAFYKGGVKATSKELSFVNPLDWMNAIISNGIDRRILHLQFMRDMEFHSEYED